MACILSWVTTIVVLTPGWGDHVQASKAGLLEVADLFVVNKADRPGTRTTIRDLRTELTLAGPGARRPPILETQAHNGEGISELDATVQRLYDELALSGELEGRRTARLRSEIVQQATTLKLVELSASWSDDLVTTMVRRVRARELTSLAAARELANLTA
jgi:LAO/AO transport system kinase